MPNLFKEQHTLEVRSEQAKMIRTRMPGSVPVICQLHEKAGEISPLPKVKYLVEKVAKGARLRKAIRTDACLAQAAPLHLYLEPHRGETRGDCEELLDGDLFAEVDEAHADPDGFLYVRVSALSPVEIGTGWDAVVRRAVMRCVTPPVRPAVDTPHGGAATGGANTGAALGDAPIRPAAPSLDEDPSSAALPPARGGPASNPAEKILKAADAPVAAPLQSPHGEKFAGASAASCSFLNPR